MKVAFSINAKKDLIDTVKYISKDKPGAARNWAAEIKMTVTKLGDFPRMGRNLEGLYSGEDVSGAKTYCF